MKKTLLSFVLLFAATAMSAQTTIVKGDMNGDKQLTIADAVSVVDVILGNASKEEISVGGDPYAVDNTLLVGTWYAPDGSSFTLDADGATTGYPGATTYKFRPYQGTLLFFTASGKPLKKMMVDEVEKGNYLLTVNGTNNYTYYTTSASLGYELNGYVDLGLPSGTLWSTCNIGANNPEDCGDYFAWGETTPYGQNGKTDFNWSTYKWCEGSGTTLTKYCNNIEYGYNGFTDGKTKLDPEDDAAYVNWGPAWRMPSLEQMNELRTNCTWTWTTKGTVNGYEVTGSNGNSIFLPAAGGRINSSLYNAGSLGYYWSRTLNESGPSYARYLYFGSSDIGTDDEGSCYGLSVRPVRVSE